MARSYFALLACAALVTGLATACSSGLPAVLTSTPEAVSVEFDTNGSLSGTKKLATEECAKNNLIPDFEAVEKTATPSSRVAKYRCVSPDVAAPAAPTPAAAPAPAETPEPETAPEPATDETSDAGTDETSDAASDEASDAGTDETSDAATE